MALSVPSIGRRTAKGVPRYTETDEWVDASGAVLVRVGDAPTQTLNGRAFHVTLFAPRVEGGFDRLEYWQAQDDATLAFWRVRAADGAQHLFGYTAAARLADPATPERIARWWLEETVTPHGEHVYYAYQGEDDSGIDISSDIEQPRERRAQRYLKRVCYGNRQACADLYLTNDTPVPTDWHVELVLDYGEHAQTPEALPTYAPTHAWLARADPFSEYAAGFEVRTHRLCQQVLLFHRFDALGADPALTRCWCGGCTSSMTKTRSLRGCAPRGSLATDPIPPAAKQPRLACRHSNSALVLLRWIRVSSRRLNH